MIKRLKKTYHGWWISLAGGLNTAISSIPTFSGGSIIFKAIEDEFGWSRAIVSGVSSFGRFGGDFWDDFSIVSFRGSFIRYSFYG